MPEFECYFCIVTRMKCLRQSNFVRKGVDFVSWFSSAHPFGLESGAGVHAADPGQRVLPGKGQKYTAVGVHVVSFKTTRI